MNTLTIGQDVWWSDPENKTSGSYLVLEIRKDPNDGLDEWHQNHQTSTSLSIL